jgi:hypothetical protein
MGDWIAFAARSGRDDERHLLNPDVVPDIQCIRLAPWLSRIH